MLKKIENGTIKIAVIGLEYVGLPLSVAFGKKFDTIGFDQKKMRLENLRRGIDVNGETSAEKSAKRPGDIRHSFADTGKAGTLLGYAPEHSVADGVAKTISWYQSKRG